MTTSTLAPEPAVSPIVHEAVHARRQLTLPLAPSLERRRLHCYLGLILCDGFAIAATLMLVGRITLGSTLAPPIVDQIDLLLPLYWTVALSLRAYSLPTLVSLRQAIRRVLVSALATFTVLGLLLFLMRSTPPVTRIAVLAGAAGITFALCWIRVLARPLIRRHCGPTAQNVLVFDDGGEAVDVPNAWHIDTRDFMLRPDRNDPHMLDRLGMFMTNMDRVLVTCPPERRIDWAMVLKGSTINGEIVEPEVEALGALGARRWRSSGTPGFGALVVSTGPLSLRDRAAKRAMDIAMAGSALIVLAPLLLVVAALIRLGDRGPVFFMQQRQGRNNRLFWIYKFRSMRVERLDSTGARSASKDDDRITPIGRIIRRTSIDELPQLLNVLRGDMSIVGPRPHAIGSLAGAKRFWEVDSRYLLRHSLKPGLTGLAQIRGFRGATDTEKDLSSRLQADLEYCEGWTVLRDIAIIAATLRVVVHDRAF